MMSSSVGGGGGAVGSSGGPCGACKFLRRKCVKGCIFAPYFDSDQLGTAYFAAVHKVFGASNASKLLHGIPAHRRLDAVVTLCYEALARVRDPVYGCVAHVSSLQQQVMNLQAQLAYVHARLSTMRIPPPLTLPLSQELPHPEQPAPHSVAMNKDYCNLWLAARHTISMHSLNLPGTEDQVNPRFCYDDVIVKCEPRPHREASSLEAADSRDDSCELHTLTQEFISKYLPEMKLILPPS